ncbi:hypothetical protein PVAND_000037 [Polypedilum vanderplanki]|uniref:Peptidase S1 domain-containing protein n=1 Tax=Polypedilum vanderplanki TaxID=319348 RepID=A0A9J6BJJ5_POLVA|nr:hypothetical protein PVAND_000037 [Polypedilum vanderplanki]
MKFILCISVFFALLIFTSLKAEEEISQYVINGEDTSVQDHPYMAHIYTTFLPTCGASILSQRTVLTAAHCLIFFISQPVLVSVVVGSSYRDGRNGQSYRTSRIFLHPDYVPGPNVYDIAVVRTISRIQFSLYVQPISLAGPEYIGVNIPGVFVGFGFIGYGAILPRQADRLQKMYTTTISNDDCKERYSATHRGEFVVDQKICVVSGPRTSVCGGDSGGALVINGSIAGVISWRTFPCGDGLPDVFIRISATRDWILSVLT